MGWCVCIRVLGVKVKGRAVMRRTVCGGEGGIRGRKLHSECVLQQLCCYCEETRNETIKVEDDLLTTTVQKGAETWGINTTSISSGIGTACNDIQKVFISLLFTTSIGLWGYLTSSNLLLLAWEAAGVGRAQKKVGSRMRNWY